MIDAMDRSTDPIDAMDRSKRSGATKDKNNNSARDASTDPIDAMDRCRRSGAGAGANKNKNNNSARDASTDSIGAVDRGRRSGANENKNGDSTRVPDLTASLGAMGLGDPSPQPPEQQDQRVAMLLLLQQQHRRSNAAAALPPARQLRPIPLMEGLQVARQYWPQSQPQQQQQPYPWEEIGSSGGGRYVSPMGAAAAASNPIAWYKYDPASGSYFLTQSQNGGQNHFVPASGNSWGQQPCALGATASQYLQYQQIASLLAASSSTNTGQYQYQYQPVVAPVAASSSTNNGQYQYQYQPVAAPVATSYETNTSQYQYQPIAAPVAASSSTSNSQYQHQYQHYATPNTRQQYQYQHYAATPNNSGVDDWSVPGDDWGQAGFQPPRAAPAVEPPLQRMTLEETRSRLLQAPIELNMVTLPESPEHVVTLLEEGGDKIRLNVFDGVSRRVHDFMDSRLGHEVFVALLRASARAGRPGEVQEVVQAAVDGRHKLLRLTKHDYGEKCLRELMVSAAPYPSLCAMLVDRFLFERVLNHDKGDQVLHLCFATMSYDHTKLLVRAALHYQTFAAMVQSTSPAASKCLVECFDNAMGAEFSALQAILLERAFLLATGDYSNYFVQHVLEHGDEETKQRLVRRLMQYALPLSLDRSGSYVVETCFQKTGLLHLVLAEFLRFYDAQLVELVRGRSSNYVVHRLLDAAKDRFPAETVMLARRIQRLPADTSAAVFDEKVKRVVTKILSRPPVYRYR